MYDTTWWIVAFWLTMAIGTLSCVVAAIVLAVDFLRSGEPAPRRSEIKDRLDSLDRMRAMRVDETRTAPLTPRRDGGASV